MKVLVALAPLQNNTKSTWETVYMPKIRHFQTHQAWKIIHTVTA